VNGSRGQVVDFSGDTPIVRLLSGKVIRVEPHSWSVSEDGRVRAEVAQLPLRLAWAITIHKSQGMSLDSAEIDLSRAFTPGMGYVALSRVRSIEGLYLQGINRMALTMHPQIHTFDGQLRTASAELEAVTEDIADDMAPVSQKSSSFMVDEELFEKLKQWRFERAVADHVAPYMIAHNAALTAIASSPPRTAQQLIALPGFGTRKVDSYGSDILDIVSQHLES
jgi:ATP-dependent DNA helicase PIF1